MTVVASKSTNVTALDTQPLVPLTAGEGAAGALISQVDSITTTAAQMASIGSTLRLCRIPSNAKIKQVILNLGGVDTNATALAVFDFNLAFSDSAFDGTQQALQGLIPKAANDGTTTTVALYSTPNLLFGQVTASNSGAKQLQQDITFDAQGSFTAAFQNTPLWSMFGFTNSQGVAQDPGGFFDVLCYLSTAAATGAAAIVSIEVRYVI